MMTHRAHINTNRVDHGIGFSSFSAALLAGRSFNSFKTGNFYIFPLTLDFANDLDSPAPRVQDGVILFMLVWWDSDGNRGPQAIVLWARLAFFLLLLSQLGMNPARAFTVASFMETLQVNSVGSVSVSVNFANSYASPVPVCTYVLASSANPPAVVRISSVSSSGMVVRVEQMQGGTASAGTLHCIVVEQGFHTLPDGRPVQALRITSTGTHGSNAANGWNIASMQNISSSVNSALTSPVVLGQVMTSNDARGSVFHANNCGNRGNPPAAGAICVTKHIGEVSGSRVNETLGVIITNAGSGSITGANYTAGRSPNSVQGTGNAPPYAVSVGAGYTAGTLTQAAENGGNGGWAVFYGASPFSASGFNAAIEEEIDAGDRTRTHIAEEVSYWLFAPTPALDITKTASFFTDLDSDGEAGVGDVIRYTYTVTNTGSIPVADVFVSDVTNGTDPAFLGGNNPGNPPHVSLIDNGISSDSSDTNSDPNVWGLLAEDDAIVFQADYTVTQTDVEALQ